MRLFVARLLLRKLRPDRDARPRLIFAEPHFEALLREFDLALAQREVAARRAPDEFLHARQVGEIQRHVRDGERHLDRQPAKLVEFVERALRLLRRLARVAAQLDDRRLDGARFEQRRHARRFALHERRHQFLAPPGNLARRLRPALRREKRERPLAHLRRERRAELIQPRVRELHLTIRDGLAQRNAARPFKRLLHRHGPRRAFRRDIAAHALAPEFARDLGIRPSARRLALALRGGDLGFVKLEFRILGKRLRDERIERDRCRRLRLRREQRQSEDEWKK